MPDSTTPRVFVSHSHRDDVFTMRLVEDLRRAGVEVWVDMTGMDPGVFMQRISQALDTHEWMVLVLTPAAIASQYVQTEVFTALHRVQQGTMRAVVPILAAPCTPGTIPALWDALHRFDATRCYTDALAGVLKAIGLPTHRDGWLWPIPPNRFPRRLANLGFTAHVGPDGIEYILPPLCHVPAGDFLMGSNPNQDPAAAPDEQPQHSVKLAAYQIGRHPITVAEYACYVQAGGKVESLDLNIWKQQLERLTHPVVVVGFFNACGYPNGFRI